jgi:hypothetical protein
MVGEAGRNTVKQQNEIGAFEAADIMGEFARLINKHGVIDVIGLLHDGILCSWEPLPKGTHPPYHLVVACHLLDEVADKLQVIEEKNQSNMEELVRRSPAFAEYMKTSSTKLTK